MRDDCSMSDAAANHLCERVGWLSPYYLCLLLDQTMQAARDRLDETPSTSSVAPQKELVDADVDNAYERLLSARSRFIHWEERIKRDLAGLDLAFTLFVLTALSKRSDGLTLRQLSARIAKLEPDADLRVARLQGIAIKLQEEGYIGPPDATGRVTFLSFLLRDYWGRNHV